MKGSSGVDSHGKAKVLKSVRFSQPDEPETEFQDKSPKADLKAANSRDGMHGVKSGTEPTPSRHLDTPQTLE